MSQLVECERCKRQVECTFYGRPADVDDGKAQGGTWLCDGCVYPMMSEWDEAIDVLEKALEDENEDDLEDL